MHSLFLPNLRAKAAAGMAVATAMVRHATRRVEPLAFVDWPTWAKELSQSRKIGDSGLGDTVIHVLGDARSEKFKNWWQDTLKTTCGCTERQAWLNARFPYL